jgi:Tfp pilus assembly protein PilO
MIFSKRERYILLGTAVVVGALAADRLVLTPLMERQSAVMDKRLSLQREEDTQKQLLHRQGELSKRWAALRSSGLEEDPAVAESALLHSIRQWSQDAGLTLVSMKPDRPGEGKTLREIMLQVSATGPMKSAARFLWLVESSPIAVRIKQMQIGSRKEGSDDLSLTLTVSTLYIPPETPAGAVPAAKNPTQEPGGNSL